MSNYLIQGETLANIADAIREKTGSTDQLSPTAMASAIAGIQAGGGDDMLKGLIERTATEIVVPEGTTKIGDCAFYEYCDMNTIILPQSLTTIGNNAFRNCNKLKSTSLPGSITSIGAGAFYMCAELGLASLPSGITKISDDCFNQNRNLAITSLPSGVTSIGNRAFFDCPKVAITSLPSGVTSIGNQAFYSCKCLNEITFNGTPTKITSNSFGGNSNLLIINVPWAEGAVANAPWGATNATINYNYTGG